MLGDAGMRLEPQDETQTFDDLAGERPLVAFDFDGTLTTKDSFMTFLAWRAGPRRYALGLSRLGLASAAWLLHRDRGRLKAAAVAEFLKKWQPEKVDAEELLAAALKRATAEDKRVLVHVGTPYCGWCKVLTRFLDEQSAIFSRDYVDLKLDTLRMTHGEAVAARYLPEGSNGVPWMVILDASGKVLSTGVGPGGNIGYPYDPAEVEHFLAMLASTKQRLGDDDLQAVRVGLEKYRAEREQKLTAERAAK